MVQNFYKQALKSVYSDSLKCRSWRGKKIWDGEKIAIRVKRQNGELISSEHNSFRGKCFFYVNFRKKTVFHTCQAWQLKLMVLKNRVLKNVPFSVKDLFNKNLLEKLFWLTVPAFAWRWEQRSLLCYQDEDSPKFVIPQLRWHDLFSCIVDLLLTPF